MTELRQNGYIVSSHTILGKIRWRPPNDPRPPQHAGSNHPRPDPHMGRNARAAGQETEQVCGPDLGQVPSGASWLSLREPALRVRVP